jgi:hypothetical protein
MYLLSPINTESASFFFYLFISYVESERRSSSSTPPDVRKKWKNLTDCLL